MPETIESPSPADDRAARLLFLLFIHVADAGDGLTARDVQSLNRMLDHPDWTQSPFLRSAQIRLRAIYFDLWQDYQKGGVSRDPALIRKQWMSVLTTPGAPKAPEFKMALDAFLGRLARNASPFLLRLGLAFIAPARRAARAEIDHLLKETCQEAAMQEGPIQEGLIEEGSIQPPAVFEPPAGMVAGAAASVRADWPAASLPLLAENAWRRGRIEARCVAAIPETADVRTFVLLPSKPMLMVYEPGQFVTLELPIDGKTVRRSYTLSSSPSRPHAISITVKRCPEGVVSNWLHDHLQPGATLVLSGPHGQFSIFNAPARKLLLMAAGSGITPIMSMLRWLADTASTADIVLINNVRTPSDIIFARELEYIGTRLGDQLRLGVMPAVNGPGLAWNGPVGHLSEPVIRLWAPDFAEREVFVCGPAGYMKAARATLGRMGLPMAQYHEESFGAPAVAMTAPAGPPRLANPALNVAPEQLAPAIPGASPPDAAATVEIVFAKSGKTAIANEGDFLLDLAEEHGVAIESGCRSGNCGACKVLKTEGKVVMEAQTALNEDEIADGYVLTCVGQACGPKVVLQA